MKYVLPVLLGVLLGIGPAYAQAGRDRCHVYIVDVAAARRALDSDDDAEMQKAAKAAQTLFPEFFVQPREERITTKHFSLPGGKQTVTASVYYTDESMASSAGSASIVVGVAVGPRPLDSAVAPPATNNAVAEASYGERTGKVRAKQYVTLDGKSYLVGIECDCQAPTSPQPKNSQPR